MKNAKFNDAQMMEFPHQTEDGIPASELCREHVMSRTSSYEWRAKFGGVDESVMSAMKSMPEENHRLKRVNAETSMQNEMLKYRRFENGIMNGRLTGTISSSSMGDGSRK